MNFSKTFLIQTARDYDMRYETVLKLSLNCDNFSDLYVALEEYLKERRN